MSHLESDLIKLCRAARCSLLRCSPYMENVSFTSVKKDKCIRFVFSLVSEEVNVFELVLCAGWYLVKRPVEVVGTLS